MGEVTEKQRAHVIKDLGECEEVLTRIREAFDNTDKLEKYSSEFYDKLLEKNMSLVKKSIELAGYINKLDSEEPPFILFQGNAERAKQSLPLAMLIGITAGIENTKYVFFDAAGNRITKPEFDRKTYVNMLHTIRYALTCFNTLRKSVSKAYKPEEFHLGDVLEDVIEYWSDIHGPKAELGIERNDRIIIFDKEVFYWIIMRMLRNAQYATQNVEGGWIRIQVIRHKDGNFYLIVRNNGKSVEDMAKEVPYTRTNKTMLTMKKICEGLGSDFAFKDFPDHTRACLRLPPARKAVT